MKDKHKHNKEVLFLASNKSGEQVNAAYEQSVSLTGVRIDLNQPPITSTDWKERETEELANESEKYKIPKTTFDQLTPFGSFESFCFNSLGVQLPVSSDVVLNKKKFTLLWEWFVQLSLPSFKTVEIVGDFPTANGYVIEDLSALVSYEIIE